MKKATAKPRQASLYPELEQPELPEGARGLAITDGRCYLPFQLVRDRAIGRSALIVAAYLDNLAGREGYFCWLTNSAIATDCGICLRSVQQGLEELRASGYLCTDWREFRGKWRRLLFMLWKVPETLPQLDGEAADSARSCAETSARSCASNASAGANNCASNAQDPAPPHPISNSVLGSKEETGTARTRARPREDPVSPADPPPRPEPSPPPAPPSPGGVQEPTPTPEQIAQWQCDAARPGRHDPVAMIARMQLAALANPKPARAAPPPSPPGAARNGPGSRPVPRAEELADALANPDRADSVEALVAFCACRFQSDKPETREFWATAFTAARNKKLPLPEVKAAILDTAKPRVKHKAKHLSASLANVFRRAKTTAAGPD